MNLTELFTSIAEAIRNKKNTTEKIKASDFANEITTIEGGLDTSDATATANDIVKGATAYVKGTKIEGNIQKYPSYSGSGDMKVYDSGSISVSCEMLQNSMFPEDAKITLNVGKDYVKSGFGITADKIKTGETIAGVEGTFTSDSTATAEDMAQGATAYVNGELITGTITKYGGTNNVATSVTNDTSNSAIRMSTQTTEKRMYSDGATIQLYAEYAKVSEAIGLQSEQIVSGETVLGVEGTFAGGDVAITDASYLFYNGIRLDTLNELIGLLKDITATNQMFYRCTNLTEVPLFDTSNVTDMSSMFNGCGKLTTIPQFDTSNVTNMGSMFNGCEKLTTIPQFDTSNVTNMSSMFNGCNLITEIPLLDTGNVTSMPNMFAKCASLTTIPQFNMSNVTKLYDTFNGCTSLTEIPQLDISNVSSMDRAFYNCKALVTIPELDASKVTDISGTFYNNTSLVNLGGLKNLGKAFKNTSKTLDISYSTLLTYDSLMNLINNLYDLNLTYDVANGGTLYTQQLVLGATNLAKLTEEEIATCVAKGWSVS